MGFGFRDRIFSFERETPVMPWESTWDTAKRITDNRLRAMRFHIQADGPEGSADKVAFLRRNLLVVLKQFAAEAALDRYDEDRTSVRLQGLIAFVEDMKPEDGPTFPAVYEFMGVEVPWSVWEPSPYEPFNYLPVPAPARRQPARRKRKQ